MPKAHLHGSVRMCGALTIVKGNQTVFVNDRLWAVKADIDTHCLRGALIPVYPPTNVFVQNKNIICAVGDLARSDRQGCVIKHPAPLPKPLTGSPNTFVYAGVGGG